MKRFLCTSRSNPKVITVELAERPEVALGKLGGRASPIFSAAPDGSIELPASGGLAFVVPVSPQSLLAKLLNDYDELVAQSTYMTHGLAAVVLVDSDCERLRGLLHALDPEVRAFELWPMGDGAVQVSDIEMKIPEVSADPWCELISDTNLDFGMASQVRQFNSNIAHFSAYARRYIPEYHPLVEWLCESVQLVSNDHARLAEREGLEDDEIRRLIGLETLVVELNAILTMFTSQAIYGALPIHEGSYPVGEYSLLGVGGMARAVWRLYAHMHQVFTSFDHVGRIQYRYGGIAGFDPYAPAKRINYSSWVDSQASVGRVESAPAAPSGRFHIPHFSSRWGFHESYYGLSISWQCIHACATKEWNLLTFTHEFLHSHVRDLLGVVLDVSDNGGLNKIVDSYNKHERGQNALESMQLALIESLVGIRGAARLCANLRPGQQQANAEVPQNLKPDDVIELMRAHGGFIHELMVHVLDFLYVYNARDERYINSVWSSWALVPIVNDRIFHYVLRTLCTLSLTSTVESPDEVFTDVTNRLRRYLVPLQGRERTRPAIDSALAVLADANSLRRLDVEFRTARYIVRLSECFFYDGQVNALLVRDAGTTVRDDQRTYALSVGEFRGEVIESPVGLLLDRFTGYRDHASEDVEYESIWQMLILI